MKYINKKRLLLVFVGIHIFLLVGCKQVTYLLPYDNTQSGDTYLTDVLMREQYLKAFATELCVVNQDIFIDTLDMSELAAVGLFDISQNEVIFAQNANTQLYPASLTKVMTAIVVLKYSDLDTVIEVTEPIVFNEYGVTVAGIEVGDCLTIDQALNLLLISSANDAAVILAEEIGGSIEGFCQMMNEEAKALGATNTNFVNPHGLHNDNNYTTVYDLYLMFQEALTYNRFSEITSMASYETLTTNIEGEEKKFTELSTNQYFREVYEMPTNVSIVNSKTGTTNKAGNCLMVHAKDIGNNSYIAVILNAAESKVLYERMSGLLLEIY